MKIYYGVDRSVEKDIAITEYSVVEEKGADYHYFVIKLGEDEEGNPYYYKNDSKSTGIIMSGTLGMATHIASEQFAIENLGYLKNFYDRSGNLIAENADKTIPPLAGVAEAAEILGWDKRKVATYISRGSFPEPVQRLASGPIWAYRDIIDYRDSKK